MQTDAEGTGEPGSAGQTGIASKHPLVNHASDKQKWDQTRERALNLPKTCGAPARRSTPPHRMAH
eukprot:5254-Chlamydomonas_euryale.AAC.2